MSSVTHPGSRLFVFKIAWRTETSRAPGKQTVSGEEQHVRQISGVAVDLIENGGKMYEHFQTFQ